MAKGKIKFEKPWISFLNPFDKNTEAKIWLFNLYVYNGNRGVHHSVTIDILNITIVISWRRIEPQEVEEL